MITINYLLFENFFHFRDVFDFTMTQEAYRALINFVPFFDSKDSDIFFEVPFYKLEFVFAFYMPFLIFLFFRSFLESFLYKLDQNLVKGEYYHI